MMERKILGRFQNRYGPNRVGPFGLLQPLADIVKLLTKEQFRPRTSIGWLFTLAPILSIVAAVAALAIIPFGDAEDIFGTPTGLYGIDVSDRLSLRVRARRGRLLRDHARRLVVGLEVLVPRLDARRSAADLLRGRAGDGADRRRHHRADDVADRRSSRRRTGMWYVIPQFLGFLIFMVASFAETNRPPFDLVEADAELVGGYNTEYGGGGFALYYFAEYMNVLVVSGLATTLFLGGWLLPFGIDPPDWVDPFVVIAKMMIFVLCSSGYARRCRACATTS